MHSLLSRQRVALASLLAVAALTAGASPWSRGVLAAAPAMRLPTFCNPIDLEDRLAPLASEAGADGGAETSDPVVLFFQGRYWLFTARGGTYWHTTDFGSWTQVEAEGLPAVQAPPSVAVIGGRLHFVASEVPGIFVSGDPAQGVWTRVAETPAYRDPALFADDDGRVYLYYGSAEGGPIRGVELDPLQGFKVVRGPLDCIGADPANRGWEIYGEDNRGAPYRGRFRITPLIEAASMTKHGGHYYLQYAAPIAGTYTDAEGVYVGDGPLGPFDYAAYSPFSHKPSGFVGGAGHGSLFTDSGGQLWRAASVAVSLHTAHERRLALYPAGFFDDGQLAANTYLGDYPRYAPGVSTDAPFSHAPRWMLLSYHKRVEASSTQDGFPAENALDENVRTRWSAATARPGEWLHVDLGKRCRVEAVQLSFANESVRAAGTARGAYRYYVEASNDGKKWKLLIDRRDSSRAAPHDYAPLAQPAFLRHLRLLGVETPEATPVSVSELRVFGSGLGRAPSEVRGVAAGRDATDPRRLRVSWAASRDADFHIVRYGVAADRLFSHYQVYDTNYLDIGTLNAGTPYYVAVDAVNDSGVTRGRTVVSVK